MKFLQYWWVVPGGLAALGYLASFAGLTRAQRAEWVGARIVDLDAPPHGESKGSGIPVTVSFRDPRSGADFTLPNTPGKHGFPVREAWLGREVFVSYPKGQPEQFRIAVDGDDAPDGRGFPLLMLTILLVGLVVHAAVAWGYPWAFVGAGLLAILIGIVGRDAKFARIRGSKLADPVAVPAEVVAVTTDTYTDGEGGEIVNHAPVVAFTATDGRAVLVQPLDHFPDPGKSLGRKFTLHYARTDPTVYTLDLDYDRRDREKTRRWTTWPLAFGLALVVAGVVLISRS